MLIGENKQGAKPISLSPVPLQLLRETVSRPPIQILEQSEHYTAILLGFSRQNPISSPELSLKRTRPLAVGFNGISRVSLLAVLHKPILSASFVHICHICDTSFAGSLLSGLRSLKGTIKMATVFLRHLLFFKALLLD
jgi:hypothetical protein